jgi:hypothetical protein
MPELLERDVNLYQDRCRGMRKIALAEKYGLARNTVAAVIERVKAEMPPLDRAEIFDQSVEILDAGLEVFIPRMLEGDKGAARVVDRYVGRRNEMLGLDSPARLELYQAQNQVQHEQVDVKAELAALLSKIRNGDSHGP